MIHGSICIQQGEKMNASKVSYTVCLHEVIQQKDKNIVLSYVAVLYHLADDKQNEYSKGNKGSQNGLIEDE